jgi:hypothetical protein
MRAKRLEYHQGAISDVKSAVAGYRKHSRKAALGFIEGGRSDSDLLACTWQGYNLNPLLRPISTAGCCHASHANFGLTLEIGLV